MNLSLAHCLKRCVEKVLGSRYISLLVLEDGENRELEKIEMEMIDQMTYGVAECG